MSSNRASPIEATSSRVLRPGVSVERGEPRAKLLMLGDAAALMRALPAELELPRRPNAVAHTRLGMCLWLRPTQRLLLLSPAGAAGEIAARMRAVDARDAWTLDAGARYTEFKVSGHGAAAVLNAGCSLDLREAAFPVDTCAQSCFAQIPILLYRSAAQCFEVFAERPLSAHLWRWLCRAAEDI